MKKVLQFYHFFSYQIDIDKTKSPYVISISAPWNSRTEIALFYNFYCLFLGRSVSNFFNNRCKSSKKGRKVHLVLKNCCCRIFKSIFYDYFFTYWFYVNNLFILHAIREHLYITLGKFQNDNFPLPALYNENALT